MKWKYLAIAFATVVLLALAENALISVYLPRVSRFATDFSPTFLDYKLRALAANAPQAVFMGDSALWGYALSPDQNAVALLAKNGCRCDNLAFKAGGPPNYYGLARLFDRYRIHPSLAVLEINQPSFNPDDQSYRTLNRSLAALAAPVLETSDRTALGLRPGDSGIPARLEDALSSAWLVYGARADLRAVVTGDIDPVPARRPTADDFLGTYDLTPLDESNVAVQYLEKTVDTLHEQKIPVAAFMSPTNHALVHEYIDVPAYRANREYLARLLERRGVIVIDLDQAIPAQDFIDNTHLTADGQRRLAALLLKAMPQLRSPR